MADEVVKRYRLAHARRHFVNGKDVHRGDTVELTDSQYQQWAHVYVPAAEESPEDVDDAVNAGEPEGVTPPVPDLPPQ